jgi:signal peptide peptidase SppA
MDMADLLDTATARFTPPAPLVTVLHLSGVIAAGAGFRRRGLNIDAQSALIEAAFRPRHLSAVALAVNSPGGSAAQSALIAKRIRAHAGERKVPVLAFVQDVAASGGYWLAAAADEIFAETTSLVGSIGVVSAGFGLQDAIARLGIERRLHTKGAHKRLLDPFQPEQAEGLVRLDELQTDIHEAFKDWVRLRRGDRLAGDDETLFQGDVWTGPRAVELGLIDGLGDLREILRDRYGEKLRLRDIAPRRSLLSRLTGRGGATADIDWADSLVASVEERLVWNRWSL